MKQKSKILGQVYTPKWIVNVILDEIKYHGKDILDKYIFEPSCGDGTFLREVVNRYIFEAKQDNLSNKKIVENLEKYIWGVEIDTEEFKKCISILNKVVEENLSENYHIQWNIFNTNTLFFIKIMRFFLIL